MRWRFKSLHFKLLSLMPGGKTFHMFTQEQVTRSTEANHDRVRQKVEVGLRYWDWLQKNGRAESFLNGQTIDFGAGWHPTIPLLWHLFGARRQLLLDIQSNMDTPKVADTVRLLNQIASEPGWVGKPFCQHQVLPLPVHTQPLAATLRSYGIEYRAPYKNTLAGNLDTYDSIICTQVLQHIDRASLENLFSVFFRSLKPGGLLMGVAHLVGHFRSPNLHKGQYQHLESSPWVWDNLINSSLMSFNRLKGPDYRRLLEQSGFRIHAFEVEAPTPEDLAELKRTKIHPSFDHLSTDDLAAKLVFFVAEKP